MKHSFPFSLLIAAMFCAGFYFQQQDNPDDWFAFSPSKILPTGSALDASAWLDAPAGKHGPLHIAGKDLQFADGTPIRFWGVNICSQQPFSPAQRVDDWVNWLAYYGVNGVRFHKFSWYLANQPASSTLYDTALMHRMDYFHAQLKQRGIYTGWSHIYGHRVQPGDSSQLLAYQEVAALDYPWKHLSHSTSALVNFAPDLQDLNIGLTVNLLNHRNPHTGLRYADDPALAFVEIQNEDNIFWSAIQAALKQAPTYRGVLCQQFSDWLKKKYNNETALLNAWGNQAMKEGESLEKGTVFPDPNHGRFSYEYQQSAKNAAPMPPRTLDELQFLYDTQVAYYQRFVEAIRATGYQGVIVGSCWQAGSGPSHFYNLHADYLAGMIDRHNYFGGGKGHQMAEGPLNNEAMVNQPGSGLLGTGLQQVADRPFSFSEWMSLVPNEWVAEGPAIVATYGMGLQGWDASFQFASDHTFFTETIHTPGVYNVSSPTQLGLYPALSRMVYRGDVAEAAVASTRAVSLPELAKGQLNFREWVDQGYDDKRFSGDVPGSALALGRAVVAFDNKQQPSTFPDAAALSQNPIRSTTGQLAWHTGNKGFFTVNTPGTKAVVGFANGQRIDLEGFVFEPQTDFAVIYLTALSPKQSLQTDIRWLLTTIARARNTGMEYNADRTELLSVGKAPILLEPVKLRLQLPGKKRPIVHVLDHSGKRTGKTIATKKGQPIVLDGNLTQTCYYELVWE